MVAVVKRPLSDVGRYRLSRWNPRRDIMARLTENGSLNEYLPFVIERKLTTQYAAVIL